MDARKEYSRWLENCQGEMLQELQALQGNDAEIQKRFGSNAAFGTAGIRSIMGVGTAYLNDLTVRRTARGLAKYLLASGGSKTCAIGYDCRNNSRRFAEVCAAALAAEGIKVYLYDRLCPTPMLSFAVRYLKTGVGMVISASKGSCCPSPSSAAFFRRLISSHSLPKTMSVTTPRLLRTAAPPKENSLPALQA